MAWSVAGAPWRPDVGCETGLEPVPPPDKGRGQLLKPSNPRCLSLQNGDDAVCVLPEAPTRVEQGDHGRR